jgi:acetoin utilization deacetylase AcuC-like enzyme
MAFGYVLDPIFAEHRAPGGHPEREERIQAVLEAVEAQGLRERGEQVAVRDAREEELGSAHDARYLASLEQVVPGESGWLDSDTYFSPGSWEAVLSAAGAAVDLGHAVMDGRFRRAAALVRPPGHHAEADRAMGFCLINNAAVAAATLRDKGARVSVFDFDVHHGNGTQHIFEEDPEVQYISIHQYPFYPGTGAPGEVGRGAGLGATVNVGLPAGCGDADYLAAYQQVVAPQLARHKPDIVLLSAGFDAYEGDPLAGMKVSIPGYRRLTRALVRTCDQICQGRLVAVLEGGYDLQGLSGSVVGLLEEMIEEETHEADEDRGAPSKAAQSAIDATLKALKGCQE